MIVRELSVTVVLIFFLSFVETVKKSDVYHSQFAVNVPDGKEVADVIAAKHGFVNLGQIGSLENHFLFDHPRISKRSTDRSHDHHRLLHSEPQISWFEQQRELTRKKRDLILPDMPDPLFRYQWFLNGGAVDGSDMNVKPAWSKGFTGRGITVTILDDGIQTNHPDLAQNYDPDASTDINGNDDDPMPQNNGDNKHGTRCAGEVAAVAFNEYCGVGVAYNASIGGVRMLDGMVNDAVEARALSLNPDHIDIYSASWGPEDDGKTVDGPGPLAKKAFINGIENGRKKLGSIFVWASGNGGRKVDNCNCDGYTNSIFTLSISSATQGGRKPWYLEECSSTLATTYSSGTPSHDASITTVDQDGDLRPDRLCTSSHTGTSASAPIAAGICALALQANPGLTWRDMQHLVVMTANPYPLQHEEGWAINGVGRHYSHKFGYGLMNAAAMVDLALTWPGIGKQLVCQTKRQTPHTPIPSLPGKVVTVSIFTDGCDGSDNKINFLEHVQCFISIRHSPRGALNLVLTSPTGTRSSLLMSRPKDMTDSSFDEWPFMSVHFWGESPIGNWTLEVSNDEFFEGRAVKESGTLISWYLLLYGTEHHPLPGGYPHDVEPPLVEVEEIPDNVIDGDDDTWEPVNVDLGFEYASQGGETCHPECLGTCSGPGNHQCHACKNFLQDGRCISQCPSGTYATIEKSCLRCHRDCLSCFGPEKTDCIACRTKSNKHFFVDVRTGSCVTRCPTGSFVANSTICQRCPQNCDTCADDGSACITCSNTFVLSSDKICVPQCPDGQFSNNVTKRCEVCHHTCATCVGSRSSQCGQCRDNLFYYERSCVDTCPSGFFPDPVTRECSPCSYGCTSCVSEKECRSCQDNWQISVIKSPNSGSSEHVGCLPTSHGQCNDTRKFLVDSKCRDCHASCDECFKGDDQSCLSCQKDHFLHITSCVDKVCPNATFLFDATECRHCPHACSSCESPKSCRSCHLGYVLSVSGQCITACPEGQRPDHERHCRPCSPSCLSCTSAQGSERCTACNGDRVLLGGDCLDECPNGFYQDRAVCKPCHVSCDSCSGPSLAECQSCHPGWALNVTCLACTPGHYYNASLGRCLECHKDCFTCRGPDKADCVTCNSHFLPMPVNHTCLYCCQNEKLQGSDSPCCNCNDKRDSCVETTTSLVDVERSTQKRSSWGNDSPLRGSSRATLLFISFAFFVTLFGLIAWRRFCRHERKRRQFRFRRHRRIPKSPQNDCRTYEKLPMTETIGIDEETFSSSEDDFGSDEILMKNEDRRRLVSTSDATSAVDM